jgi:hypothetical protein
MELLFLHFCPLGESLMICWCEASSDLHVYRHDRTIQGNSRLFEVAVVGTLQ